MASYHPPGKENILEQLTRALCGPGQLPTLALGPVPAGLPGPPPLTPLSASSAHTQDLGREKEQYRPDMAWPWLGELVQSGFFVCKVG